MNITPITKKYTNPYAVHNIAFAAKGATEGKDKKVSFCNKTIVKNTLNEFGNSRENFLIDMDLADFYVLNSKKLAKKSTPNFKNINFLADMPLCDAYELPAKKDKNLQLPFGGTYPQYLADQDVVEQYEVVSNGIKDVAKTTYCSFGGSADENVLSKVFNFVKNLF